MWKIIDNMGQEQSIAVMMAEHPELIGYDESGLNGHYQTQIKEI